MKRWWNSSIYSKIFIECIQWIREAAGKQSPFFTKFNRFKDWILPKVKLRNHNTSHFHVSPSSKLWVLKFFENWVNWTSAVIAQILGLPIWKMKWIYILLKSQLAGTWECNIWSSSLWSALYGWSRRRNEGNLSCSS